MKKPSIVLNFLVFATLIVAPSALAQTPDIEAIAEKEALPSRESWDSPPIAQHDEPPSESLPLAPLAIASSEPVAPESLPTAESLYGEVETQAKFLEIPSDAIATSPLSPPASESPPVEFAQAAPVQPVREGFYGSISADWRFLNSIDITGVNIPNAVAVGPIRAEFNSGLGINGAAGYKFPNNIRVEGQIAYGRNAIGDVNLPEVPAAFGAPVTAPLSTAPNAVIPAGTNLGGFVAPADIPIGNILLNPGTPPTLAQALPIPAPGAGTIPAGTALPNGIPTVGGGTTTPLIQPAIPAVSVDASGSIATLSGLLNVYYDLNTQSNWEPYIGGGIGISRLSANDLSVTYPGTTLSASVDGSTWSFAYQLMAGVAYYFNPRTAVTVGYRYFDPVGNSSFDTPLGEVKLEGIGVHNLEVGLRYFF